MEKTVARRAGIAVSLLVRNLAFFQFSDLQSKCNMRDSSKRGARSSCNRCGLPLGRSLGQQKHLEKGAVHCLHSVLGASLSIFSLAHQDLRLKAGMRQFHSCILPIICPGLFSGFGSGKNCSSISKLSLEVYPPEHGTGVRQWLPCACGSKCGMRCPGYVDANSR